MSRNNSGDLSWLWEGLVEFWTDPETWIDIAKGTVVGILAVAALRPVLGW